jgi:hypothetical protein
VSARIVRARCGRQLSGQCSHPKIWEAARADGYPAVADFLEGRCGLIDEALAKDDQTHDAAMEQAWVRGFAATG